MPPRKQKQPIRLPRENQWAPNAVGSEEPENESLDYITAFLRESQSSIQTFLEYKSSEPKKVPAEILTLYDEYYDVMKNVWGRDPSLPLTQEENDQLKALDKDTMELNKAAGRRKWEFRFPYNKIVAFIERWEDLTESAPLVSKEQRLLQTRQLIIEQMQTVLTLRRDGIDFDKFSTKEFQETLQDLYEDDEQERQEHQSGLPSNVIMLKDLLAIPTPDQRELLEHMKVAVAELFEILWAHEFDQLDDYLHLLGAYEGKMQELDRESPILCKMGWLRVLSNRYRKATEHEKHRDTTEQPKGNEKRGTEQPKDNENRGTGDEDSEFETHVPLNRIAARRHGNKGAKGFRVLPPRPVYRVAFPGFEDGVTDYGKVVFVRKVGCGMYVFLNIGTEERPYFRIFSSADFPRGYAQNWYENPSFRSEIEYERPSGRAFKIKDIVSVERSEDSTAKRNPPSYAIGYIDGKLTVRSKSWAAANCGRKDWQRTLRNVLDDRAELKENLALAIELGVHPDTGKRLRSSDHTAMPWIFQSVDDVLGSKNGLAPIHQIKKEESEEEPEDSVTVMDEESEKSSEDDSDGDWEANRVQTRNRTRQWDKKASNVKEGRKEKDKEAAKMDRVVRNRLFNALLGSKR